MKNISITLCIAALIGSQTLAGCKTDRSQTKDAAATDWASVKAERVAAYNQYINVDHKDEYLSFRDAPVGTNGIPLLLYRLFPVLFPEIWGDEQTFARKLGLFPHPDAAQGRVLPLGVGVVMATAASPFSITNMTCAACHTGYVKLEDGSIQLMVTAPSTIFNIQGYSAATQAMVNSPNFTFENFKKYIDPVNGKPAGWFYGTFGSAADEAKERALFMSAGPQMIAGVKQGTLYAVKLIADKIGQNYDAPGKPSLRNGHVGSLDAMGTIIARTLPADASPAVFPSVPDFIDVMSVWGQNKRYFAQWTGDMKDPFFRNLGAETGVVGDSATLNVANVAKTVALTAALPPPVYPFPVNSALAAQGEALFTQHCATCHWALNQTLYKPQDVGTDPNRVKIFNPTSRKALVAFIRQACLQPGVSCPAVSDDDIMSDEVGYMAAPLDGIWARAPYLHNGSIPTIRQLLVPSTRPPTFWRGNPDYDQVNLGFAWDQQKVDNAQQLDTSVDGFRNTGHTGVYLRSDGGTWSGRELDAVIEYMKTL